MPSYSKVATTPPLLFSHQYSVTGLSGVGKSAIVKALLKLLGERFSVHSAGSVMLEFAQKLGITKQEFSKYRKEHPEEEWDRKCDDRQMGWATKNSCIIDGRLSHIFARSAMHIYISTQPDICALRRAGKDQGHEKKTATEVLFEILERDKNDKAVYEQIYPDYNWPLDDYDFVVYNNDDSKSPEYHASRIIEAHNAWYDKNKDRIIISSMMP